MGSFNSGSFSRVVAELGGSGRSHSFHLCQLQCACGEGEWGLVPTDACKNAAPNTLAFMLPVLASLFLGGGIRRGLSLMPRIKR